VAAAASDHDDEEGDVETSDDDTESTEREA
jgi:hypothetical protein